MIDLRAIDWDEAEAMTYGGLDAARVFGPERREGRCPYPSRGDDGTAAQCTARGHCGCYFGRQAA